MSASATLEDKSMAENDIGQMLEANEKRSDAIRKRLRRIAGENKTFAADNPGKTGEIRVRVNTHQGLTKNFMGSMQAFEESQEKHRDNVRGAMERQLRMINPTASDDEINDALRKGAMDSVVNNSPMLAQLPPDQQAQLRNGLEDLKSRNNDIKKLEESIIQLHQLFMDMQILVEGQGELLNDIEYNIEGTKGATVAAHQELVQAREHQKSANKKKLCIALLIIAILIAIIVPLLVKFIPKWFPQTKDAIDDIVDPFGIGANKTESTETAAPVGRLLAVNMTESLLLMSRSKPSALARLNSSTGL